MLEFGAEGDSSMTINRTNFFFTLAFILSTILALPSFLHAQTAKLSVHWEELTASDFREGIHRSRSLSSSLRDYRETRPASSARHRFARRALCRAPRR